MDIAILGFLLGVAGFMNLIMSYQIAKKVKLSMRLLAYDLATSVGLTFMLFGLILLIK